MDYDTWLESEPGGPLNLMPCSSSATGSGRTWLAYPIASGTTWERRSSHWKSTLTTSKWNHDRCNPK